MISIPLIHTQLVPPSVKNCIQRTQLQNLGFSILAHHVTTIIAPAGYGKSVWIASLLKEKYWPTTAWISLDRHNSEPSSLLYHLIHAINRVLPKVGSQSLRTVNRLEDVDVGWDWLITAATLIEEISQDNENEIVLVLDDFHLIKTNSIVCNILEYLTHWLPAKTHLIFISRNNPPLNLYREQLNGELLEIRSNQLLFSIEEVQKLFLQQGFEPGKKEIAVIHHCTEGWPAALRLLVLHLKQSGGDINCILTALQQKDADLFSYLNKELLNYLPDELYDFLLNSSLLPYLEAELCNAVFQCNDSTTKINELDSLGMISRIKGTSSWRLHHLIEEFLAHKVMDICPPDYVVSVRRRVFAFFKQIGNVDRALERREHLNDFALSVAGVIAMEAGRLELAQQRFEKVVLSSKCKGALQVLAGAHLFLARLALIQGNDTSADSYLSKALGAAETEKWEYFWDWHDDTVFTLCQRALIKQIHPKWAAYMLKRWFPQRTCQEACSLLVYPDETVKNSITVLIKSIVQETGARVVHVNCLGGFRVFVAGDEISLEQWKTKKSENLFKLLIMNRYQQPKEKIIEELWSKSDPKAGDSSLRMALTHVRKALGLKDIDASIILRRGMIFLNPEIEVFTDYEFFVNTQRGLNNTDISNSITLVNLEQAARLYSGDFMPENLYDDWSNSLRTELRFLYLQVLLKQVEGFTLQGKVAHAIQVCRRYLALEPADEQVSRTVMELLWQSEQKKLALSLYHELVNNLITEYDILPSAETTRLYDQIRCE